MIRPSMDRPDATVALDERGNISPLQDAMDEDQELLASEPSTSMIANPDHSNSERRSILLIGTTTHSNICRRQLWVPATLEGERSKQEVLPGVCAATMIALVLSHFRVPAAKRASKGTLLGGTDEAAEKFGPLKAILGSIPALFANREVCPYPPT